MCIRDSFHTGCQGISCYFRALHFGQPFFFFISSARTPRLMRSLTRAMEPNSDLELVYWLSGILSVPAFTFKKFSRVSLFKKTERWTVASSRSLESTVATRFVLAILWWLIEDLAADPLLFPPRMLDTTALAGDDALQQRFAPWSR